MSTLIQATLTNDSITKNGMSTHSTSFNKCLDLFFLAGGSRNLSKDEIEKTFLSALSENPELAIKILFWARDIRGGAGERRFFRICTTWLSDYEPNVMAKLSSLVPEYGRYDDLFYCNKDEAIHIIKNALQAGDSLCAKWMPRKGSFANVIRKSLGLTPKEYRKLIVNLTNVVEQKLCAKEYDKIEYSKVPSKAFAKYQKAFMKRDESRFNEFLNDVADGKEKINAAAIFPNDIIRPYLNGETSSAAITEQWNALPNYMKDSTERIIPVCDVSGSMSGRPMEVSVALGLYISERNQGIFKDAFITFSASPKMQYLKGNVYERVKQLEQADWDMNTDLQATFKMILDSAVSMDLDPEEMPTKILIISDMEFDSAIDTNSGWGQDIPEWNPNALEMMRDLYNKAGFEMPGIVFWNVNGSIGNVPTKADTENTALVSGFSPSILTSILGGEIAHPAQVMFDTINSERYDKISEKLRS